MSSAVADLQGFKNEHNDFIIKEAAILTEDKRLAHFLFRPPYDWTLLSPTKRKEASWLEANYHGLDWNNGFIPYESAAGLLHRALQGLRIYVKGEEKKTWLAKFLKGGEVVNVEDLKCDLRLNEYTTDFACMHHRGVCALNNVFRIDCWLRNNQTTAL